MTCIVFKDGVIASDSQLVGRGWSRMGGFDKIGRRKIGSKVYLFGATGETAYCYKFMVWVQSDAFKEWLDDPTKPTPELEPAGKDESCTGLLFMPDDTCWRFEGNYPPYPMRADYYAFGSGDAYALGALGKSTAMEAVEQVIKHDVLSNGPVQSLRR
jgi:hypothetical protein